MFSLKELTTTNILLELAIAKYGKHVGIWDIGLAILAAIRWVLAWPNMEVVCIPIGMYVLKRRIRGSCGAWGDTRIYHTDQVHVGGSMSKV